jgi:hypothetical protein
VRTRISVARNKSLYGPAFDLDIKILHSSANTLPRLSSLTPE